MKDENIVQKVLRHEATWIISLVVFLYGIITTVVLPLQELQIQVAQLQSVFSQSNSKYEALQSAVNALNVSVGILQSQVNKLK